MHGYEEEGWLIVEVSGVEGDGQLSGVARLLSLESLRNQSMDVIQRIGQHTLSRRKKTLSPLWSSC
jgi:hypothetical protein